ncbi:hypothetical protein [Micromonospora sp. NPDC049497]|uniref:hypothetical protein n=1 Tax=Micromonospora sp. NPDC049497 TaxID=3364273 RepID=UPI0037A1314C
MPDEASFPPDVPADRPAFDDIGLATSTDLLTWERHATSPVRTAAGRWYERHGNSTWHDEAWRDPWCSGGRTPGGGDPRRCRVVHRHLP